MNYFLEDNRAKLTLILTKMKFVYETLHLDFVFN